MRLAVESQQRGHRRPVARWRCATAASSSADLSRPRSSKPTSPPRPGSARSARASRRCRRELTRLDRPAGHAAARAGGRARRRRASGSSAATAGRTTSATAASITSLDGKGRQHPGARYRGVLEHRRPAVEGDADGRRPPSSPPPAKATHKKDLALLAMAYGHVYVARVAFGAKDAQTVKAFPEAEAYPGTVADHRLQPLHRARLRHGERSGPAEAGGRTGVLAALPVRSAACGRR